MKRGLAIIALGLAYAVASIGPAADGVWARPPLFVLEPIPNQTVRATETLQFQVRYRVEDPVCWTERLWFSLAGAPSGMAITSSGRVSWTPTATQRDKTYAVTVHAFSWAAGGSPCWGVPAEDFESFTVSVLPPPSAEPPTSAINIELSETAMNNALASLTEVRGINFGRYLAGFVDAWWMNLDTASIDILVPSPDVNRARLTASATANAVLDLFVISVPASASARGTIEGELRLAGAPNTGYTVMFHPTSLDVDAWIHGVPGWLSDIIIRMATGGVPEIPDIELNLGTQIAPLLACVPPRLTTNEDQTALILEWDVNNLRCPMQIRAAFHAK